MRNCTICKNDVKDNEVRIYKAKIFLCEDCYIDKLAQKPGMKWSENDQTEFFRRLKTTYSVRKQQNQEFPDFLENMNSG